LASKGDGGPKLVKCFIVLHGMGIALGGDAGVRDVVWRR
jgi:hypothetical protein